MRESEKNSDFLKTLSTPNFDLLESNSIYIFVHENKKIYHRQHFFSWCMFRTHVKMHFLDSCGYEHAESGAAAESFEFLLTSLLFFRTWQQHKDNNQCNGYCTLFEEKDHLDQKRLLVRHIWCRILTII